METGAPAGAPWKSTGLRALKAENTGRAAGPVADAVVPAANELDPQRPGGLPPRASDLQPPDTILNPPAEQPEYQIELEPPGPERIFGRLDSEPSLQERMRQEARGRKPMERISFPEEPILSREQYVARVFPPSREVVEPYYVCFERLYFEQPNMERYGWDLGFVAPFASAGKFFWDVVALPYNLGTEPCRKFDCSAGWCLPGDPVPFMLYPPQLSLTGALLEGGTVVGLFAIFPG
jgi:hypothetical protein